VTIRACMAELSDAVHAPCCAPLAQAYYALEECMGESGRVWAKCQKEVGAQTVQQANEGEGGGEWIFSR